MGRITFGDIAIAGILTLVISFFVACAFYSVAIILLGSSIDSATRVVIVALYSIFAVGGVALGVKAERSGYPVLKVWATTSIVLALVIIVPGIAGVLAIGDPGNFGSLMAYLAMVVATPILVLFFVVGLAGFLNSRRQGPTTKSFQSVSGQGGVSIYPGLSPAIFEGIEDPKTKIEAPGSLYRRRV